ncbi:unnamed protein product [Blepharisma stoltei]|uniref:Uncharacterized protein n=1 Tax=Blepharisma stoltei TaxID=1481888 RepID=A0AAU9KH93_9CILI|nr:unnamed protein product [Blepharisma stoltei]
MASSSTCLVLGSPGSGKTSFITRYLYSFHTPTYFPSQHPKHYRYTLSYPPPSSTLEIVESCSIPENLPFSSVLLVYDPSNPSSLDHIRDLLVELKKSSKHQFGCLIVAIVRNKESVASGIKLANEYHLKLISTDIKNRLTVKRCFQMCWQWIKKNLTWEDRKGAISIREKVKKYRLA